MSGRTAARERWGNERITWRMQLAVNPRYNWGLPTFLLRIKPANILWQQGERIKNTSILTLIYYLLHFDSHSEATTILKVSVFYISSPFTYFASYSKILSQHISWHYYTRIHRTALIAFKPESQKKNATAYLIAIIIIVFCIIPITFIVFFPLAINNRKLSRLALTLALSFTS